MVSGICKDWAWLVGVDRNCMGYVLPCEDASIAAAVLWALSVVALFVDIGWMGLSRSENP
jgi:hypothetical protein